MSRRDTKVLLTKPLLGSRRHCKAGITMASNDLNPFKWFCKLVFLNDSHITYALFSALLIPTPWNVTCVLLTHWDADMTSHAESAFRVFSVGYQPVTGRVVVRWSSLNDTWHSLSVLQ